MILDRCIEKFPTKFARVEEFQNKFAKPHWRVEAKQFLPHPDPSSCTNAKLAAAQRSNKQQTNIKQSCGECLN